MKKMKIVYCIPGIYASGGMERVLSIKANYLTHLGHEIHIVITDGGSNPPCFSLDKSVKIHQLFIDFEELYHYSFLRRVWLYKLKMIKFKKKLDNCLCQIRPDITVSLLRRDINIINGMTDGSLKVGEIHFDRLHYRNFNAPSWLPSIIYVFIQYQWMNSLIRELRKLSKFIVLTHEDAGFWPELSNIVIIPNPTSFFPDEISDCTLKQVIAAGRFVSQKGFDHLIDAWRKVVDKHPDWVLKIYGDGWMREQLQQQVFELELTNNCYLEHTTVDIAAKFQKSSIFVLSSIFEGFGLVIVEAMACGLPVVSYTCHCGPRDIISDEVDGLLVSEGDVDELAEKISRLIEDKMFRQKMGQMARLKAADYKVERIGAQWITLFETLLVERR